MSRLEQYASRLGESRTQRSLENPQVSIGSQSILQLLGLKSSASGRSVTPTNAVTMVAVYRSMALLSGVSAMLPLHTFKNGGRERTHVPVIEEPHPDKTDFEIWENVVASIAGWGNAFVLKRRNLATKQVQELWPIYPDRMKVQQFSPTEENPSGKVFWMDNSVRQAAGNLADTGIPKGIALSADFEQGELTDQGFIALTNRDIFHVPGFGYDGLVGLSPIGMAREAIAAGLNAEEYANMLWSNGALVSGIITTKQKLNKEKAGMLKQRWDDMVKGVGNAHEVVVMDSGAEFKPISIPPEDAQFLQTREFQVGEIARLYGIPPHLLGLTERSTSWGTGIEVQNIGLITYTLHPGYLRRIEKRATRELIPAGEYGEFQLQSLMRGDNKNRSAYYKTMKEIGAMTSDEIRKLENMPPLTEEQKAELKASQLTHVVAPTEPTNEEENQNE